MRAVVWLSLAALALCGCARSTPAELASADSIAAELRKALPGYHVAVVDNRTIAVRRRGQADEQSLQLNLDRIADYCARAPDGCADAVGAYIDRTAGIVTEQSTPPSAAGLRVVVRPVEYLAELNKAASGPGDAVVSAPLAGDVAAMCYLDLPDGMRPMLQRDLAAIGVPAAGALETCKNNTRASLARLPAAAPREAAGLGAIGVLEGDPYESSYLALHADWDPLANKLGGRLIVSAPDAHRVLYAAETNAAALNALSAATRKAYDRAERPISRKVFRWTASGWEVAAP